MAPERSYPRRTLENALRVPRAIKEKNGGNPWPSAQVATALALGAKSGNFFYITTASRDYGLTEGSRDSAEISLTPLGRRVVYPQSPAEEQAAKIEAFLNVDIFRRVLEHFGGDNLPEQKFLSNTLQTQFGLHPDLHEEFVDLFKKNCKYLGIGKEFKTGSPLSQTTPKRDREVPSGETVTVGAPEGDQDSPVVFVIMPFVERDDRHDTGFFEEVLNNVFTPAATEAGFTVKTARRQGSDVIQSTIVNDLLEADLVLADLTEHNPNVLFELGMRMHADKPVALVRAKGTGAIFDVDNMLRVEEYSPNLWPSTVERDVPAITEHLKAAWSDRDSATTFMKILRHET
jgi:hypothetical protein